MTFGANKDAYIPSNHLGKIVRIPLFAVGVAAVILSGCGHARSAVTPPRKPNRDCAAIQMSFVVDREYDAHTIYSILHGQDPAGLAERAAGMGLSQDLARKIHAAASYESVAAAIRNAVATRYQALGRDMARARGAYMGAWTPQLKALFSERIIGLTGHCWRKPQYTVVVSAFHPGLSSWHGNIVASRFDHDLATKRRIVAHEIVLSQLFQLFRSTHPVEEVGDWPVWAFAEITAAILLDDPALRPYWPKFPNRHFFARSNYPQLADLEAALRHRFRERKSFDEYLSDAAPLLKELDRNRLLRSRSAPDPP